MVTSKPRLIATFHNLSLQDGVCQSDDRALRSALASGWSCVGVQVRLRPAAPGGAAPRRGGRRARGGRGGGGARRRRRARPGGGPGFLRHAGGAAFNGAPFNGAPFNGVPFNGTLYIMAYDVMACHI